MLFIVKKCDICDAIDNVSSKSYIYNTKMGAAGSIENVYFDIDICETCELIALRRFYRSNKIFMQKNRFTINEVIIEILEEMKGKKR